MRARFATHRCCVDEAMAGDENVPVHEEAEGGGDAMGGTKMGKRGATGSARAIGNGWRQEELIDHWRSAKRAVVEL